MRVRIHRGAAFSNHFVDQGPWRGALWDSGISSYALTHRAIQCPLRKQNRSMVYPHVGDYASWCRVHQSDLTDGYEMTMSTRRDTPTAQPQFNAGTPSLGQQ